MNVLSITGNLAREIEIKKTSGGIMVANGTLAVLRAFKGKDGDKATDYIDFVAWDRKAEYLSQYAKKGCRLEITGRLESRRITEDSGLQRIVWECVVENVTAYTKRPADYGEDVDIRAIVGNDLPYERR